MPQPPGQVYKFHCPDYRMELLLDASSTRGPLSRKSPGRMKHLDVQALWFSDLVAAGGLRTKKIDRFLKLPDPLTRPPSAMELEALTHGVGTQNISKEEYQRRLD